MTLVLALGNRDQVIQVSDRRLTDERGQPCLLPENEATMITLADARLICGFAGMARAGRFRTGKWVTDSLLEAPKTDHLAHGTVERFADAATKRFTKRDLLSVPRQHRALSVLFTGYRDVLVQPRFIAALVTDYQNFETGFDEEPWDEFRATYWSAIDREDEPNPTYLQRIGRWSAMVPSDELRLRRALEERRSPNAIVEMAVGVMREIAARPTAVNTIGKEISSAVLGASRPPWSNQGEFPIEGGFHPQGSSHDSHAVNQVVSLPDVQFSVKDPVIFQVDSDPDQPMIVQKVGRNRPCPCGSGKKYKKCHGS